jgi:hypothetical protein
MLSTTIKLIFHIFTRPLLTWKPAGANNNVITLCFLMVGYSSSIANGIESRDKTRSGDLCVSWLHRLEIKGKQSNVEGSCLSNPKSLI